MSEPGGSYETSFRTSSDVDVVSRRGRLRETSFLSFLAVAQSLKIDILPLTWDAGRNDIGSGATARVMEALINIHTRFAFKRANKQKLESEIFRSFTNEIAVLSHSFIREHPNIAQLQGICWEISATDDKPWPVLVFEKTSLGDLYSFAKLPASRSMNFSQRLKLCVDIGTAIMAMHSVQIVHGDLKPENVLVFPDDHGFTAMVTDFGYSTRYAHEGDTIKLPISHPWNGPEVDRLNREWTPSEAKKADLFSFGMLCLWVLFPAQLSQWTIPGDSSIDLEPLIEMTPDLARSALARLKANHQLQNFAQHTLESVEEVNHEDLGALNTFLSSCLSTDPSKRLVSIRETWRQLGPERLRIVNSLDVEEDWQVPEELYQIMVEDIQRSEPERPSMLAKLIESNNVPNSHFVHIYLTHNRMVEAERSLRREVDDLLDFYGDTHPMFTTPAAALVSLYTFQCRWKEAGDVLLKVLAQQRAEHGEDGPSTLINKANMAFLYGEQGRWAEAETLQREMLEVHRRDFSHDDSVTLNNLANLAMICKQQGKWVEAEGYYIESIHKGRSRFGPEYHQVLTWTHNLAVLYQVQGRWKEAMDTMEDVIEAKRRTLGEEHPDTVAIMGNLASLYCDQELTSEAATLQQQVLAISKRILGDAHPETVTRKGNLAVILAKLDQYEQAGILQSEVLEVRKRDLGLKNPLTLSSMGNLADVYRGKGQFQEAENLQREALELAKDIFDDQHPSYLYSQAQLAAIVLDSGRLDEAEGLTRDVMQARKDVLGLEHPETLSTMCNLTWIWMEQGRYRSALEQMKEIHKVRVRLHGPEHKLTKNCLFAMDMIRTKQGEEERDQGRRLESASDTTGLDTGR
ncbi:hypothetical protein J7T55_007251 [Diaporthe amygdali]|uniref:uncharacterized protein n=1 Tax=Phomopsis amygdali TaxID=1214568 RepID=UPI0022FE9A9C|nr:uncharacterized protein J7T55_007251 [Diaporthe amygdali]KAJ0108132.1 hypothetical protein J7T55_007251 [Diaporthe amygdali]